MSCAFSSYRGQKKAADLIGLMLHIVMSRHVLLGSEPVSSERTANTPNYRTISPDPKRDFFYFY